MLVPAKNNRISHLDETHPLAESQPATIEVPGAIPQRNLFAVVWRRRWMVLGLALLAVVVGFVYVQKATPIFVSSSRIYVEQNGPRLLNDMGSAARQADSYIYAQAEVIQSTPIVSRALDTVNASRMKSFAGMDNPLLVMKDQMKVEVGKKDDLITVSFESPYPEEAAQVVNGVVQSYLDTLGVNSKSSSAQMLEILQKDKEKRDQDLQDSLQKMVKYKETHPTLALEFDKNNISLQKLSRLSDLLSQAQIDAQASRAEWASVKAAIADEKHLSQYLASRQVAKENSYVNPTNMDREIADLRSMLHKAEMEAAVLMGTEGENNPIVITRVSVAHQLRDKILVMEREYAGAFLNQANRSAEVAEKKVTDIQTMYEAARKEATSLSSDSLEYDMMDLEMKRLDHSCQVLDDRIKELSLTAEDATIGRMKAQILDVGRAEDKPAKPKKALVLAAALMLGLMFGSGSALAADWMDQRLRSVEEIRMTLGAPVLGLIPHMKANRGAISCGQAVALEPMSETAEAYRTIRTAVYFGTPDGESKKILITSPAPGDGKSTMASNLAIAMAQAGQRVVLLDCDFRRPTQHKAFELKTEVGLSSVVAGTARVEETVQHSAAVEGLDILPCGPIPPNPAELLNSQAFSDLLDRLAETYDHVLIDAPPVLAVTDARILAAIADQTILVLRAEKSTRNMSLAARDGILSVGGQLLGVVINDVPKASKRDGYYYAYGYYRYGYYGQGQVSGPNANGKPRLASPVTSKVIEEVAVNGNGSSHGKNGKHSAHTETGEIEN